jgi:hypothetical protein
LPTSAQHFPVRGQPVAKARPGLDQRLVRYLDGGPAQYDQPSVGEPMQNLVAAREVQLSSVHASPGVLHSFFAQRDQAHHDLANGVLLVDRECLVPGFGRLRDGPGDPTCCLVTGSRKNSAAALPPGLEQGM